MALMFIGRVAPLSLVIAITTDFCEPRIKYPEGEVIIG
jgi:Trk-type K+ transport system membrane component